MRNALIAVLLAGLAGCSAVSQDYGDKKDQSSGKDAFGESFGSEWRKKDAQGRPVATQAATPAPAIPGMSEAESREFEDWRAWQEWKRQNPK